MSIFINPLGELELLNENGKPELVASTCNMKDLSNQLGRDATPSDVEEWFEREARKAIKDERDWRLYQRYMELARAGFSEGRSLIRIVATNFPDRTRGNPRVWLTRYIYTEPGSLPPDVPDPWEVSWVQTHDVPGERWEEWDAGLDVTYMDSGEIFRHAYALEEWVVSNPWAGL